MAPVQEANSDNLGKFFDFLHNDCMMCPHHNRLDEAILISTHNIQFHDNIRKISKYLFS